MYRQRLGTAIGTKVAPIYATLVLGFLEEKLFSTVQEGFRQEFLLDIRGNAFWRIVSLYGTEEKIN
jgi:hypothetical protein